MSIYIKGMELPDSDCVVTLKLYGDGRVIQTREQRPGIVITGMNEVAGTAVELPEHGRLGDLDALLADHGLGTFCPECKRDERSCQFEMIHTTMDFCGWIEDAPTIIPADGGE